MIGGRVTNPFGNTTTALAQSRACVWRTAPQGTCFTLVTGLQQVSSKHSAVKADLDPLFAPSWHLGIQHDLHRVCIIPA